MRQRLSIVIVICVLGVSLVTVVADKRQADQVQATVDKATGEFTAAAHPGDASFQLVKLPRNPDPARERYSGDPANPFTPKTAAETAAYFSALKDTAAGDAIDASVDLKAAMITALWGRLGRQPTLQEIAAERARFVTIRKSLTQ